MKTLTVVSPVYNEEEVIESFYIELRDVLNGLKDYESKILFAVDRCQDRTLDILKRIAAEDQNVQILALSSRFGHQMSLIAGIDHADSDAIIMMDCDLQHPPAIVPDLVAEFEKGNDIVYTLRTETEGIRLFKKIATKLFYRIYSLVSDTPLSSNSPDFRLISRKVAKILKEQIQEHNIFLRGIIDWIGFKKTSVTFVAQRRLAGQTKYKLRQMVEFGIHGITSFSKKPLKAAVIVGFIFAVFGFFMAVTTFISFFFSESMPTGWATLVVLLSVFSGTQLIFLGIIGEYIGAIFDEAKGRPHYIVEEQVNFKSSG